MKMTIVWPTSAEETIYEAHSAALSLAVQILVWNMETIVVKKLVDEEASGLY